MSSNWQEDIREFHRVCDHYQVDKPEIPPPKVRALRFSLVKEEMEETLEAIVKEDLVGVADGIADSIVVLLGTANAFGIHVQEVWDEVHKANMAKVGGEKREDGKSLKPEGWKPADVESVLRSQGAKL